MSDLSKIRFEFYSLKRAVEDELRQLLHLNLTEDADIAVNNQNLNTLLTCLESDCDKVKTSTPPPEVENGSVPKHLQINVSCALCRSNGETKSFVRSHSLKDSNGAVTCPVLRAYVCPICGATGERAHTVRYCPENKGHFVPKDVLKHLRNSTGHNFVYKKKYC